MIDTERFESPDVRVSMRRRRDHRRGPEFNQAGQKLEFKPRRIVSKLEEMYLASSLREAITTVTH